ncbi:esterase/lipase family protein [Gordonia sp. NPDC003424]
MSDRWLRRATWGLVEPPRAMAEIGLVTASLPALVTLPRRGPRHPVLVVPGLGGGPTWALALRTYLRALGYPVYGPQRWAMKGGPNWVRPRLISRLDELAAEHRGPVSVVAWSVGGCAVREVAFDRPDLVRQVITLGTPLTSRWYSDDHQQARETLPVPATAVWSRFDHIFPPTDCLPPAGSGADSVEILSSHLGMASNAAAWWVVADRLAQPVEDRRPFTWRHSLV